jgi:hypothetical protein
MMTIAKVSEISASSEKSFDDAVRRGIERASKTLDNISGAWVNEMKVDVEGGKVTSFRVNMKVTFVLRD